MCSSDLIDHSRGMLSICNKKSGLLGVSGVSSDMREVTTAAKEGNEDAQIAWDMLVEGVRKYIGAYAAVMNGVDVISFAGGKVLEPGRVRDHDGHFVIGELDGSRDATLAFAQKLHAANVFTDYHVWGGINHNSTDPSTPLGKVMNDEDERDIQMAFKYDLRRPWAE